MHTTCRKCHSPYAEVDTSKRSPADVSQVLVRCVCLGDEYRTVRMPHQMLEELLTRMKALEAQMKKLEEKP